MIEILMWEYYAFVISGRILMSLLVFYLVLNTMTSTWACLVTIKKEYKSNNWHPDVNLITKLMASIREGCRMFRNTWTF